MEFVGNTRNHRPMCNLVATVSMLKKIPFQTIQFSICTKIRRKYTVQLSKNISISIIQFSQTILIQTIQFSISMFLSTQS